MHYVTLDHIDAYLDKKSHDKTHAFRRICKEVFQFGAIFVAVFLLSTIVVNANLFYHTMKNAFSPVQADDVSATLHSLTTPEGIAEDQSRFLEQQIEQSAAKNGLLPAHTETMSYYLSAKMKTDRFQYNTLPPENRLIIPAIGVNAPIVDISAATEHKLRNGDFDEELNDGVVKYPSTPQP